MLTLIEMIGRRKGKYQCECGNITVAEKYNVLSGNTKSCGCLKHRPYAKTHGHNCGYKRTKVYSTWKGMRSRCNTKDQKRRKYYADKGITCCERWYKFENFLEDMGEPKENETLDRIDNSKGYFKENCRWTSMKVQCNNKDNNTFYECNGKKQTLAQWSDELGIEHSALSSRIKRGWSLEKVFSTPKIENRLYTYQDQSKTLPQWALFLGIDRKTLSYRLAKGVPIEVAFTKTKYLKTKGLKDND